jgi:hypothetical protein
MRDVFALCAADKVKYIPRRADVFFSGNNAEFIRATICDLTDNFTGSVC